jgi:hypothetical protein
VAAELSHPAAEKVEQASRTCSEYESEARAITLDTNIGDEEEGSCDAMAHEVSNGSKRLPDGVLQIEDSEESKKVVKADSSDEDFVAGALWCAQRSGYFGR